MKLLIIEDEPELSKSIAEYLSSESYLCEFADTFQQAFEKTALYSHDCILLDPVLGFSGLEKTIKKGKGELSLNGTDILNTLRIHKTLTGNGFSYVTTDY